jgi:hypothetical protein
VDTRTHRFPVGDGQPAVEIRNALGSVTVDAVDGTAEYVVEIDPLDSAGRQALDAVEVSAVNSRLRVVAPERRLLRGGSFAVRVTAPAGTAVRVACVTADAELRGELGKVELTSASGDCAVDHCADLQLRSASGDARVGTATGRAVVGTASGDLRIESAAHGLQVRTASGDVDVRAASGDVSVTTGTGDVEIGRITGGTVGVKTVSGDVSLGVVPGLRVWLDLSTLSGRMESSLDEGIDPGEGPAQLTLSIRTVSGDQRVVRAAGAAPVA